MDGKYVPSKRLEKYRQGKPYITQCLNTIQQTLPKMLYISLIEDISQVFSDKLRYEVKQQL